MSVATLACWQHQPCPFPGAGGAGVGGFCSCRKEVGLWQGRLMMSPHSSVQMLLLAVPAQDTASPGALWAGEKWEWEVSSHCYSQSLSLLHLQTPLYFKNIKSFLWEQMLSEQGILLNIFYLSQSFLKLNVYHSEFTTAVNSGELTWLQCAVCLTF